jgi:hypothetical protein
MISSRARSALVLFSGFLACGKTNAPAPPPSDCDRSFSLAVTVVADDVPGSDAKSTSAADATKHGVPCYAPGPHDDFKPSLWCCKPGTTITAYGGCDPRFPRHVKNVTSMDQLPADTKTAVDPTDAIAQKSPCYAPGPHTAFNMAHWCCVR